MKHKFEVFENFKKFRHKVEKQTKKFFKILRSDRGEEYLSGEFLSYLRENGIVSYWTLLSMPQLNEISEWRNRILLDIVWSMISFTDLSFYLWGHALLIMIYLLNKVLSKSVPITPYEI